MSSMIVARIIVVFLSIFLLAGGAVGQARKPALRSVTVITEPASKVWIDGVHYGVTDENGRLVISSVLPGVRQLKVRANGFAEATRSLTAATRGEVAVKLVKTSDEAELAYQSAEGLVAVDREKAIGEYDRAIRLRPAYFEAFIGLARAYADRGDIENAFKAAEKAKKLRPANAEATVVEARLLKDSGEEAKAIAAFKRAITIGKGFQPEANTGLGLLYKDRAELSGGTGDYAAEKLNYEESAKYLAIAVNQLGSAPDAMVVYQILGLIYERQERYKDAIALYENFLRLFPDSSEAGAVESFIVQIKKQMNQP
jgi:tetratricopeptide (TPR) repeat protein